jgi:hypothetical protein
LDVNPVFSAGGLAYDGSQYHLLLESDADEPSGQEIFLVSYNSLTDLLNDNQATASFSQLDVNPVFSTGGLAFASDRPPVIPLPPAAWMGVSLLSSLGVVRKLRKA